MFNQKEYSKKYYIENKDKLIKQAKQWKENNPEYKKKYRENHP